MGVRRVVLRAAGVLLLALALATSQGCSRNLIEVDSFGEAVGNYFADRAMDMLDFGDVGITISTKPRFCFYANGVSMGGGGLGYVEGYFAGIGGGNIGWVPFYTANVGLFVWCYEELAFGDYDPDDVRTVSAQGTGIAGLLTGPLGRPAWKPACIHYLHLGWVGFVGNINYLQPIDLMAGFIGLDPARDDGYRYGLWPWEDALGASDYAGTLRSRIFNLPSEPPKEGKAPSRGGTFFGRSHRPLPPLAAAAAGPQPEEPKKE